MSAVRARSSSSSETSPVAKRASSFSISTSASAVCTATMPPAATTCPVSPVNSTRDLTP